MQLEYDKITFSAKTYWYKFKYKIIACLLVTVGLFLQFKIMCAQIFYDEDVNGRQIVALVFLGTGMMAWLTHYQEEQLRRNNFKKDVFDKQDSTQLREKLIRDMALSKKDDHYGNQMKIRTNENYRSGSTRPSRF